MLVGMGLTFAAIGTLAAVGGAWAVRVNDYGRLLALILLTVSGLTLLSETVAGWITRPVVALGSRLLRAPEAGTGSGAVSSLVLGIATGFLWAPCAGPILGHHPDGCRHQRTERADDRTAFCLCAWRD